ncbi:ubiquitin-like domain-containing protein [Candidatus Villigracilis affinis]|uniref:ubiquitin-like domain-containing protein n=1 Tax=Candidatus Villigracilis affinis TaxID=3140682 RepID=UPI001D402078|nr:ubiquitin-like domain-containing protein [Anaerolineales bacterium]
MPLVLLTQNGITPQQADRVLVNGVSFPMDQPPAVDPIQLQRRAVELTPTTPLGTQNLQTSAPTVGQALTEAGYVLGAADLIDPPAETSS